VTSLPNPVDYPDFVGAGQQGSGVLFNASAASGQTLGPWYVGNVPSTMFKAIWSNIGTGASLEFTWFTDPANALASTVATAGYTAPQLLQCVDVMTNVAPYLQATVYGLNGTADLDLIVTTVPSALTSINAGSGRIVGFGGPIALAAGARTNFFCATQIPGAAYLSVAPNPINTAADLSIAAYDVDYLGNTTLIGAGQALGLGAVTVGCVLGNNATQVFVANGGGALVDFDWSVTTGRGA
jgi:hypothetical protein